MHTVANVAHGDIKPDNVMFNELLGLTFIDLGHANPLGTKQNDNIGTDIYRAPEIKAGRRYKIDSTDIYSLACTMFTIMF